MKDLFGFIQGHARLKREDLAGEVLALLLREEAGQLALQKLLSGKCAEKSLVRVQTREGLVSGGIPDITLKQQGKVIAFLELKFWASLTEHQLSGTYCTHPLFFIVPEERVASFEKRVAGLKAQHCVDVYSWNQLLELIEKSVVESNTDEGRLFIGALDHLKEFCRVIKEAQFTPFTNEELGRFVLDPERHLIWLTETVSAAAVREGIIDKARKLYTSRDSFFHYGQQARIADFDCWLGYWPEAWKESPANGPLWVQFVGRNELRLELSGHFTDGINIQDNSLSFPLFKPQPIEASSQQEEFDRVMASLKRLAERLRLEPRISGVVSDLPPD
jgi:hypothetical protein